MKNAKRAIALLDLGAASVQTKGGSGFNVEGVDCVIRGHFLCP
jgi:hypothetical protein